MCGALNIMCAALNIVCAALNIISGALNIISVPYGDCEKVYLGFAHV